MLELPEARHLADQFLSTLRGKTIAEVETNHSPHKLAWFHGDPDDYPAQLIRKTVTGADAFGGMPELQFGGRKLVFCDGTNVRYFDVGADLPPKHQLRVTFSDQSSIVCSVQMYGAMWLLDDKDEEKYYQSAKQKVKPLQVEFTEAYFDELWRATKPTYSAKAFLATEQRFPGLGNGVLQDILFNAKINPRRKLANMADAEMARLYRSVTDTLTDMIDRGGRDTEKDLFGQPGGYKTRLCAGTLSYPCMECGNGMVREAYMGGKIYFCPVCQPKD